MVFERQPKLFIHPLANEHNVHPIYRPDIDGLRALAIISVVIFHAFPAILRGGFVGVDVFFVISGFLISGIIYKSLQRGDFSFTEFYSHRVKRIFPALILVLVTFYILGWFVLLPDEFKQLGKHIAGSAGFIQNFILWQEAGYFDTASELKPLIHLWSLAIEEQFYLIFPFLIWGAWRLGINTLSLTMMFGLVSFGLNVIDIRKDVVGTFFLPQTRFWELMAGAILAYIQLFKQVQFSYWLKRYVFHSVVFMRPPLEANRDAVLKSLLSIIGFLLIIVSVIGLNKSKLFPGWWAIAPVLGSVMIIFSGQDAYVNRKILSNRFMSSIGLISYPLYLWHWPMLSFVRIMESETPSWEIQIIAVGLSFLLAWITYRFIEIPVRFGLKSRIKSVALCALMVLVGTIGYYTYSRDGLGFRIKKPQTQDLNKYISSNFIGCGSDFSDVSSVFCKRTKTSDANIMIIGDSHSEKLFFGIGELTRNTPDSVLSYWGPACLPFFDVASIQKGTQDICADYANRALSFAENSPSIKTVIMSSRGPLYLTGKGYNEPEHDRVLLLNGRPDITDFKQIFQTAMRATIARLLAKHKQIIFVLDIPEMGFPPWACVPDSRPLRLPRVLRNPFSPPSNVPLSASCAILKRDFDDRNHEYREIVLSVLKEFPSVKLFDAAAELCDSQYCWGIKNGELMYSDDDHLSIDGARYMAKRIEKLL